MKEIKYSLIIPIYNTPIYDIQKIIEDLSSQDTGDFEVIIIDDGSERCVSDYIDNITEIMNLKVVHKENEGVSAARNDGMSIAKGDYIIFIDADDRIPNYFMNVISGYVDKYAPDILYGQIVRRKDDLVLDISLNFKPLLTDSADEAIKILFGAKQLRQYSITGSPCASIYKKTAIGEIRFDDKLRVYEDLLFNIKVLLNCRRVLLIDTVLYFYQMNDYSATHGLSNKKIEDMALPFMEKLNGIFDEIPQSTVNELRVFVLRLFFCIGAKIIRYRKKTYHDYMSFFKRYSELPIMHEVKRLRISLEYMSIRDIVQYGLFLLSARNIAFFFFKFRYFFRRLLGVRDFSG